MTNRLKQVREAAELSQVSLSQRSGVSLRQVQYIEGGAMPRVNTALALARALNVSVADLFEIESEAAASA